jgi:hypothetical protein
MVAAHDAFRAGMPSTGSAAAEESLPGVVHFAACRDAEYAWESQGQGDFTRAATAALASAIAGRMSNEAFIEAVAGEVWKRGRQHPGLMRLPANLRSAPLLGGAGARQPAAQVPLAAAARGPGPGRGPAVAYRLLRRCDARRVYPGTSGHGAHACAAVCASA